MSSEEYKIKDAAKYTDLSTDAIRFYEKKKLIQPSFRGENNYRYYDTSTLKCLIFIKRCRALNLSLKEIKYLIHLEQEPQSDCFAVNHLLDTHLNQIQTKIIELQKFQTQLQELRQSCSTKTTINHCQILKTLEA